MDSEEECAAAVVIIAILSKRKKRRRNRSTWVKPWLGRRTELGVYNTLLRELRVEEVFEYKKFLRMAPENFDELLNLVGVDIQKETTNMCEPIPAKIKLAATLRFLSTGANYADLQHIFRIHKSTLSRIIPEVCDAIYMNLKDRYIKTPSTEEEWKTIAKEYEERWNFPNCIGSIDGKHVVIKQPRNSGSYYFNYKGTFSIVLLALVDANYKFIYVDVGCNGRISDGGVYRNSSLSKALEGNLLGMPPPATLSDDENEFPYVMVADDAFPLKLNIMNPYPFRGMTKEQRIFNYRLSRARRIVENAFGILANRFRIFLSPILLSPENVQKITLASCVLHNFLREKTPSGYTPPGSLDVEDIENGRVNDGEWRSESSEALRSIRVTGTNNYKPDAKAVRDQFCDYFNTVGTVPWQDNFI